MGDTKGLLDLEKKVQVAVDQMASNTRALARLRVEMVDAFVPAAPVRPRPVAEPLRRF
jgi:hypothetical protein